MAQKFTHLLSTGTTNGAQFIFSADSGYTVGMAFKLESPFKPTGDPAAELADARSLRGKPTTHWL